MIEFSVFERSQSGTANTTYKGEDANNVFFFFSIDFAALFFTLINSGTGEFFKSCLAQH